MPISPSSRGGFARFSALDEKDVHEILDDADHDADEHGSRKGDVGIGEQVGNNLDDDHGGDEVRQGAHPHRPAAEHQVLHRNSRRRND